MAYTIKFTDSASDADKGSFTIDPTKTDGPGGDTTHTSLTLYGRGYSNYGEGLWTDLVHMLEHFCSPDAPYKPTVGQIWYDSAADVLNVYKNYIDDTTHLTTKDWVPLCDTKSIKDSLTLYLKTDDLLSELGKISNQDKLFGKNDFTRGLNTYMSGAYLPIKGGTLTGNLILPVDETLDDYQAIYYKFLKDNYLTKSDFDDALAHLVMPPATMLNIGFEGGLFGTGLDIIKSVDVIGFDIDEWGIGIDKTNPAVAAAGSTGLSNTNNNSPDPASSIYLQLTLPSGNNATDIKRSTIKGPLKLNGSLTLLDSSIIQLVEDVSHVDDPLTSLVNGVMGLDPAKAYQAATKKYVYDRTVPTYVAQKLTGNKFFEQAVELAISKFSWKEAIIASIDTLKNSLANMIGVSQVWTDVKADRAFATEYTNNTGKPIMVTITINDASGSGVLAQLKILQPPQTDYIVVGSIYGHTNNSTGVISVIVPNGVKYKLVVTGGTGTISQWVELR